jgi:hypothetical protein
VEDAACKMADEGHLILEEACSMNDEIYYDRGCGALNEG